MANLEELMEEFTEELHGSRGAAYENLGSGATRIMAALEPMIEKYKDEEPEMIRNILLSILD